MADALAPNQIRGRSSFGLVPLDLRPITRHGSATFTGTALAETGIRRTSEDPNVPVTNRAPSFGW